MKKIILIFVSCLFFMPQAVFAVNLKSLHLQQKANKVKEQISQQAESEKAFSESLKGMTDEQKQAAIKARLAARQGQINQENIAFLKEKLAKNSGLTDVQKDELMSCFKAQYQEGVSLCDQQYSENVSFFEKIANDSTLTQDQKKSAIEKYFTALGTQK